MDFYQLFEILFFYVNVVFEVGLFKFDNFLL